MSTDKSVYGLVTPEENLISILSGHVYGGRPMQQSSLVGVLQLLKQQKEDIASLNQQLSAKIISEQNIINAFGIKGEGAHSKLVIEYVSGLVAERDALAAENCIQDFIITAVRDLVRDSEGVIGWHLNGDVASWDEVLPELSHSETPATDAFTAELRAQAIETAADDLAGQNNIGGYEHQAMCAYAANLRAGRKG